MNTRSKRRYDMLVRVRNFGITHAERFPDTTTAHDAFAIVAAEVAQLEALDVAERLASHSARAARKAAARSELVDCLARAKNTARILAKAYAELGPHLEPLPEPVGDRLLLTLAQQLDSAAAPLVEQFAAHGIALEELTKRIRAFETALNEHGVRRDEHVQARARVEASLARALEAVATLDVTVANHLAGDPGALAAWKWERQVDRSRRWSRTGLLAGEPEAAATTDTQAAVTSLAKAS